MSVNNNTKNNINPKNNNNSDNNSILKARLTQATRKLMKHRDASIKMLSDGPACGIPEVLTWSGGGDSASIARHIVVDAINEVLEGDWSQVIKRVIEQISKLDKQHTEELLYATMALTEAGKFVTGPITQIGQVMKRTEKPMLDIKVVDIVPEGYNTIDGLCEFIYGNTNDNNRKDNNRKKVREQLSKYKLHANPDHCLNVVKHDSAGNTLSFYVYDEHVLHVLCENSGVFSSGVAVPGDSKNSNSKNSNSKNSNSKNSNSKNSNSKNSNADKQQK